LWPYHLHCGQQIQVLISWVPQELQTIKFEVALGAAPSEKSMSSLVASSTFSDRISSEMRNTAERKNDSRLYYW
jgi:hypothetical protein